MMAYATQLIRRALYFVILVLLLSQVASAQNAAFRLGSAFHGVPTTFAGVTYPADRLVVYDLPATGHYAAVDERPDAYLDLIATVNGGGVVNVAGFGAILIVTSGGTGLEFDPEDIFFNGS